MSSSVSLFSLDPAIDRRPLQVTPDLSLADAIATMGNAQSSCVLPNMNLLLHTALMAARASSLLVTERDKLVGIFTERDAMQAIATGQDLAQVQLADVISPPVAVLTQSDSSDLFTALKLLRQHQVRHLPVITPSGYVIGTVTLEHLRQALKLDELLKQRTLSEVMQPVVQAPANSPAIAIAALMAKHAAEIVVLTDHKPDGSEQIVGTITERDIIQLQALRIDLAHIPATIVKSQVLRADPSQALLTTYWDMQQQHVQQVLIWQPDQLIGVVTPTSYLQQLELEIMQSAVTDLQQSIDQFEVEKIDPSPSPSPQELELLQDPTDLLEQMRCNRLLAAMALRIRESLELNEILNTAVEEVRQFLQTDRVLIYQFSNDMSGEVVVESTDSCWTSALNSTIQDPCFGKNYAHAYKQGRIQVEEDIYTAGLTQCHIDILALFDVRASLVVPIIQGNHLWGLLCAYHCVAPRRWRVHEVELLQQLAIHMAIAIQQSELYQQVQAELVERKRVETQIKASLAEKEILLKEVHHRVKNNLQIISSLLRLQSDYIKDEQAMASFRDSQNRIQSMALIHEKLYQSQDILRINFAEYILDLTDHLLRSYTANSQAVDLTITAENVWLNIDTAIPCGLIINELVSNSLKHAFSEMNHEKKILINVEPVQDQDQKFILTLSDNGIGFPEDVDFRDTESLGLQLVCTFTEQLKGTIDLMGKEGTAFIIKFSELGNPDRAWVNGQ